jgi:glycosyltransferase involved in cell wall biosynthesis
MKIAHVVTLLSSQGAFGGPTTVAWQQTASLARRGHTVTLLGGWDGQAKTTCPEGVEVLRFRARQVVPRAGFSGLWSPALSRYLLRNSQAFDVIHIHLGRDMVTLPAAQIAMSRRVPYVAQTHGMIIPDSRTRAIVVDALATRRILTGAQRVFFLTNNEREALNGVARAALPLEQLKNGIAADDQEALPTSSAPDVLFCARLHPRKRVLAFADMAAELIRDGGAATFSVVGADEGDLYALRKRIADQDLQGRLVYEGSLSPDAVRDRLRRASVYVLPSVNEPFPMTVLEAMAVGTPVVITDSCHIAADLDHDGAALVTDGSSAGLASAVRRLMADASLRTDLRERAFDVLNTDYNIDHVAAQLDDTYHGLI